MSNDKKDSKGSNHQRKGERQTTAIRQCAHQYDSQIVGQRLFPNPLSQFSMDKDALRLGLVTAQYALRATRQPTKYMTGKPTGLQVLVNGMEQAGKGSAVKQLRQWVDPRLLKVEATIGHPPLASQPIWQAHTKAMPRHGDVMVYFGNWYADLLYNVMRMAGVAIQDNDVYQNEDAKKYEQNKAKRKASKNRPLDQVQKLPIAKWQDYLQEQLLKLQVFERDLAANHTKLLKCWFHVDIETLQKRLTDEEADPQFLYQIDWSDTDVLAQFNLVAATLLQQQDDWVIIDGGDKSQAATAFCHVVLQAMQTALANNSVTVADEAKATNEIVSHDNDNDAMQNFVPVEIPNQLINIDNSAVDKSIYKKQLAKKQAQFAELLRARHGRHVVFAFEGMDAAGKGGAIKRMVAPLDPREYQVYNIGAPMLYELQHPYLWRFWTRLPNEQTDRISRVAIFDRTWYGRVLVERVEGLTAEIEWQRAYDEINRFEADLSAAGTIVIKYWLAIDKEEQLKRFEDRCETPHKQFKLTDDDWRNRDKWSDYVQAAADMLARTDSKAAPWCVIATNDKRRARLEVLDYAIAQLKTRL